MTLNEEAGILVIMLTLVHFIICPFNHKFTLSNWIWTCIDSATHSCCQYGNIS